MRPTWPMRQAKWSGVPSIMGSDMALKRLPSMLEMGDMHLGGGGGEEEVRSEERRRRWVEEEA